MRAVWEVLLPPAIAELAVGPGEAELGEEDRRERVVVVLAGVHEDLLVLLAQRPRDGGRLDELGPVADDGEDPHSRQPMRSPGAASAQAWPGQPL